MRNLHHLFVMLLLLALSVPAFAVTDKEMEHARAIATKQYLRYVNNGSDYLDKLEPKSVAELEGKLKTKEKENIKAFNAIKVPSGYQSWDKARLVEFWTVDAFKTAGLNPEGKKAVPRIRKLINGMTIAAPAKEEPKKETAPAPEQAKTQAAASDTLRKPDTATETSVADSTLLAAENAALDELQDEQEEIAVKKEGSYSWVYIMVLAILVAVIVALVVFASNVLKKPSHSQRLERDYDDENLDYYKQIIEEKDGEIKMLAHKLESSNRMNSDLKHKLEALATEVSALRAQLAKQEDVASSLKADNHAVNRRDVQIPDISEEPNPSRSIYLGRANSKMIFVRADRKLNIGNSVFKLETKDGISGTFRVVDNPEVWAIALKIPGEYLAFACIGPDLADTSGMTEIVNDTPGTAVFEGGCWRVTRRARIHYE